MGRRTLEGNDGPLIGLQKAERRDGEETARFTLHVKHAAPKAGVCRTRTGRGKRKLQI
jgi:hypothetical protein